MIFPIHYKKCQHFDCSHDIHICSCEEHGKNISDRCGDFKKLITNDFSKKMIKIPRKGYSELVEYKPEIPLEMIEGYLEFYQNLLNSCGNSDFIHNCRHLLEAAYVAGKNNNDT